MDRNELRESITIFDDFSIFKLTNDDLDMSLALVVLPNDDKLYMILSNLLDRLKISISEKKLCESTAMAATPCKKINGDVTIIEAEAYSVLNIKSHIDAVTAYHISSWVRNVINSEEVKRWRYVVNHRFNELVDMADRDEDYTALLFDNKDTTSSYTIKSEDEVEQPNTQKPNMAKPNNRKDNGLDGTLKDRGSMYGSFDDVAKYSQELKKIMRPALENADDTSREALEMILHKLARIVANPKKGWMIADNPHDIAGYAKLWDEHLKDVEGAVFTDVDYRTNDKYVKLEKDNKHKQNNAPIKLNNDNFDELTKSGICVVIFEARWSNSNKHMLKIVDDILDKFSYNVIVGVVDIDVEKELVDRFDVTGVPTTLFMVNGKVMGKLTGYNSNTKDDYIDYIASLVNEYYFKK